MLLHIFEQLIMRKFNLHLRCEYFVISKPSSAFTKHSTEAAVLKNNNVDNW